MNTEALKIALELLGGLALFIYGMNFMSDGLQKAAGDKLKSILATVTRNVFMGVLTGALATALLQSSGAVTVMVIGFVSAELMTLKQAISVIMGANIGTCITAQLVAFNIGDYSWAFVIVGFIMYFFISSKYEQVHNFGQAIFAFGILFLGLNTMASAMKPLAESETFENIILKVADMPVLGVAVGAVLTILMQSSSASIAVLQNLAATAGSDGTSIIGLVGAIPILFGTNIGSTATALIASIGGQVNAKRTALSHMIFNVVGTLIFIWFTPQIATFVQFISPSGDELSVISRQIANAHLCFNLATTILFMPFVGALATLVTKLIPDKKQGDSDTEKALYLDNNMLDHPFAAIYLSTMELVHMAEVAGEMITATKEAFTTKSTASVKRVQELEHIVNGMRRAITKYLSSLFTSQTLSEHEANVVSGLMHVVSDIEHIGDNCKAIAEVTKEKISNKYDFSESAYNEISVCFDHASLMLKTAMEALTNADREKARAVKAQEKEMDDMEKRFREHHMKRLNEGKCSAEFTITYVDTIHNIERIGDSCENIADVVLDKINLKPTDAEIEELRRERLNTPTKK